VNAIEIRDLSVAYGSTAALRNVSLALPRGTLAGILGPNAAGKTTLLRALLGLVPHTGTARTAGPAAYVPQSGALHPAFPVDALGVVLMGRFPKLGWRRRPGAADRDVARAQLERVGLAERSRTPFATLSGGERQRVLVARALAQEAEILLLDEPLTGTDAPAQHAILDVLTEQAAAGATVAMTTHDVGQAAATCDRLVLLRRELIAAGPTADVFRPEVLRRAYEHEMLELGPSLALLDDPHHHHP
jgi:ABC-type Mn2+/Zn2+ transport system ATPase subunit